MDSSPEVNWDKSVVGGNDFGTWGSSDTVDDGTACWGNPRGNGPRNVSNWKDNSKYGGNSKCPSSQIH